MLLTYLISAYSVLHNELILAIPFVYINSSFNFFVNRLLFFLLLSVALNPTPISLVPLILYLLLSFLYGIKKIFSPLTLASISFVCGFKKLRSGQMKYSFLDASVISCNAKIHKSDSHRPFSFTL